MTAKTCKHAEYIAAHSNYRVYVTKYWIFYFIADSWSIPQAQSNNTRVQKCVAIADCTLQNMC